MTATFERDQPIRFSHCDPAGIVFFPQYLVMVNDLVETWFNEGLGIDYAQMIGSRRIGVPTVRLECDFTAPSRIGERVRLGLAIERLGGASFTLQIGCRLGEQWRFKARQVLVTTSLETHRALEIPPDIRAAMEPYVMPLPGKKPDEDPAACPLAPPRGYSNGVEVRGRQVYVAGMIGWDAEGRFASDRLCDQARRALANIVEVLAEAGARPEHIVRMTWYVTDKREYLAQQREIGAAFRELIGSYNAAMTAIEVQALIEDAAKVEIEATAVIPD